MKRRIMINNKEEIMGAKRDRPKIDSRSIKMDEYDMRNDMENDMSNDMEK